MEGRELAIIAVSATALSEFGDHPKTLFDAFLQKPIQLDTLFLLLERHARIPFLWSGGVRLDESDQGRPAAREALRCLTPVERSKFRSILEALDYDRLGEFVGTHPSLGEKENWV